MRLLIIAMLLLSAPAMACESYEECMKDGITVVFHKGKTYQKPMPSERDILKAIAYKLDEISRILEKADHIHTFSVWSYDQHSTCRRVCINCDFTEHKWERGKVSDWCRN